MAELKVAGNERLDWLFACHFKGDPVMPGCLGLDALWQMLGYFLGWLGSPGRGRALGMGEQDLSSFQREFVQGMAHPERSDVLGDRYADVLAEVVCEDDDHLLEILGRVRGVPCVTSTETFVYLKLRKQTYSWGTR